MSVGSVTGMDGTTGAGQVSHDLGDIAFLVTLLEVETLDIDIGGRLTQMQQLNAVRKAYNERIAELQRLVDRCGEDKGAWVPSSSVGRPDLVWSQQANDGLGGVVPVDVGRAPMGSTSYSILLPDGSNALRGDVAPVDPADCGPPASEPGTEDVDSYADSLNGQDFRTTDLAEAQRLAVEQGGQVAVWVTRDELAGELQVLRDKMDGLSSDAEIGMLGLNRLLSRRNQVLQLASNVMSSQHQTAMGLIANLKV